jgi:predicted nucleotidyltransferase
MPPDEDVLLRQMVEVIIRDVDPETIILFGSRARGEARPDSDVDLLVVEKEPFTPSAAGARKYSGCPWRCATCR